VRPRNICWSLPQMLVLTVEITPCSHLRESNANFGKSMDWTSTLPVLLYNSTIGLPYFVPPIEAS